MVSAACIYCTAASQCKRNTQTRIGAPNYYYIYLSITNSSIQASTCPAPILCVFRSVFLLLLARSWIAGNYVRRHYARSTICERLAVVSGCLNTRDPNRDIWHMNQWPQRYSHTTTTTKKMMEKLIQSLQMCAERVHTFSGSTAGDWFMLMWRAALFICYFFFSPSSRSTRLHRCRIRRRRRPRRSHDKYTLTM